MLKIKFSIGGKEVQPGGIKDAVMAALLEQLKRQLMDKVGSIRDPETGEFPTIVVRGNDFSNLSLQVEGSSKLIALVEERLGIKKDEAMVETPAMEARVFLSYASEDVTIAKHLAEAMQAKGIDVWWDKWCIATGDSFRQKIDEGISGCTHFLVLLTPHSIAKPWVNQEIDAGMVQKIDSQCRFLPVRYDLPVASLPPLLRAMHSPEVKTDEDIAQLINDIHGVSRKPPLGAKPSAVAEARTTQTGYSPAATAIAKLLVEKSRSGMFMDPQFTLEQVVQATGLTKEDVADGAYELSPHAKLDHWERIRVEQSLFVEFDRFWKPWNPADDALQLASDIHNDPAFPSDPGQIAERYGWEPRRLNPAIVYLLERRLLWDYRGIGGAPFVMHRIVGNEHLRRFVKSRG